MKNNSLTSLLYFFFLVLCKLKCCFLCLLWSIIHTDPYLGKVRRKSWNTACGAIMFECSTSRVPALIVEPISDYETKIILEMSLIVVPLDFKTDLTRGSYLASKC